jgi:hypothetical protein
VLYVYLQTHDGAIPLLAACWNGHRNIVVLLLDRGAAVNQPRVSVVRGVGCLLEGMSSGRQLGMDRVLRGSEQVLGQASEFCSDVGFAKVLYPHQRHDFLSPFVAWYLVSDRHWGDSSVCGMSERSRGCG